MNEEPLKQTDRDFNGDGLTIRFTDVAFSYEKKLVADHINMVIKMCIRDSNRGWNL